MEKILLRAKKEHGWNDIFAKEVLIEYQRFLEMASETAVSPSYYVDCLWHIHLLFTRDYEQYCKEKFGRFIHHQPFDKPSVEPKNRTLEYYKKKYSLDPPMEIWGNIKADWIWMNMETHISIPRGDIKSITKILKNELVSKIKKLVS